MQQLDSDDKNSGMKGVVLNVTASMLLNPVTFLLIEITFIIDLMKTAIVMTEYLNSLAVETKANKLAQFVGMVIPPENNRSQK